MTSRYHWSEGINVCAKLLEGIDLHADPEISLLLTEFQEADRKAVTAFQEALRLDQARMRGGALFGSTAIQAKVAQARALSAASQQRFHALVAAIEAKTEN